MKTKSRTLFTVITLLLLLIVVGCSRNSGPQLHILTTDDAESKMTQEVLEPFTKQTKITIDGDYEKDSSLQGQLKNIPENVDIIEYSQSNAVTANQKGLVKKLDFNKLKNFKYLSKDKQKLARETNSIPYAMEEITLAYNPKTAHPIDDVDDLWIPESVDHLAIPDITTSFGPIMVQVASEYGHYRSTSSYVNSDIDTVSAIEALQELQPYTRTYESTDELIKLLKNNQADTAVISSSQVPSIKAALPKLKFVTPGSQNVASYQMASILKGTKNTEDAYKYLDYRISQETQKRASKKMNKMPVNSVVQKTDHNYLTYGARDAITMDYVNFNKNIIKLRDQWQEIFG